MVEIILPHGEIIDLAKSTRTTCSKCNRVINKNEVRGKIEEEAKDKWWQEYKWICSECLLRILDFSSYRPRELLLTLKKFKTIPEVYKLFGPILEKLILKTDTSSFCKICLGNKTTNENRICDKCNTQMERKIAENSLCKLCNCEKSNIRTGLCVKCTVKESNKTKFEFKCLVCNKLVKGRHYSFENDVCEGCKDKFKGRIPQKFRKHKQVRKESWFSGPGPGAGSPRTADGRGWTVNRRY